MEIACAPHVEHLVVLVAEEVDAGPLRRPERETALALHPPRFRGCQLDEVADGARSALLGHADQPQEDLGRRLRVGQGAMAGPDVGSEAVGERAEIRRLASEQPPGQPDRVDDRRDRSLAGEPHRLVIEKCHVEARVVCDEHAVTGKGQEPPDDSGHRRRAPQLHVAEPGQRGDGRLKSLPRVRKQLEALRELEAFDPHGAELARTRRPGPQARRLQVEHDEGRRLEEQQLARRAGESDQVTRPAQPGIARNRVVEQRAREPDGNRASELQDGPCGLIGGHRAAMILHELDEPIGGIEAQLHATDASTNVCSCPSPAARQGR